MSEENRVWSNGVLMPGNEVALSPFDLGVANGLGVFETLIAYQGITPIDGGSLAACAETYFAQSEQLPTRFSLTFGQSTLPGGETSWRGGGIMLQHMPKASPLVATLSIQTKSRSQRRWKVEDQSFKNLR